jgi:hypothetical protein
MRHAGIILAFSLFSSALFAQTLAVSGGADNFMYDPETNEGAGAFETPFMKVGWSAGISGDFSTFSSYNLEFIQDPVLRSLVRGDLVFNIWLFRLGVGTVVSMFNDADEDYIPGITGSLGLEAPGGVLVNVEYGINMYTDLSQPKNISLNFGKIEMAIWLPSIIMRFVMERKSFSQAQSNSTIVKNTSSRTMALFDLYSKSLPVEIFFGGGQQTFEKSIEHMPNTSPAALEQSEDLMAFFVAGGFTWTMSPGVALLFSAEIPVSNLTPGFFFKAEGGIRLTLSDF